MKLRMYKPGDCPEMETLFYETVHAVNARDYSRDELNAWAAGSVDRAAWNRNYLSTRTVVAEDGGRIIGFGNMDQTGYLDMLYVHKDHQGRGIASAICDDLEGHFAGKKFTVHASITAKGFFEKRGYRAVCRNRVERNGVSLTNYTMVKDAE